MVQQCNNAIQPRALADRNRTQAPIEATGRQNTSISCSKILSSDSGSASEPVRVGPATCRRSKIAITDECIEACISWRDKSDHFRVSRDTSIKGALLDETKARSIMVQRTKTSIVRSIYRLADLRYNLQLALRHFRLLANLIFSLTDTTALASFMPRFSLGGAFKFAFGSRRDI